MHQAETRPVAAAVSMLAAMLVIGVIDNFVAVIGGTIGLWQFYVVRFALALPLLWLMALGGMGTMRPARLWAVAARSFMVALAMLIYFSALTVMPIAQALAGLFTSPIFVLVISAVVLRQKIGPWRILAVVMGFAGALIVLEFDPANVTWGSLVPMLGGFFYALGAIATRAWCARESTVAMLTGVMGMQGAMGVIGLAIIAGLGLGEAEGALGFVTRGWVWPFDDIYGWLLLQCVGSVVGVFGIIRAYQWSEASYVSVFEYAVMIFGPLFGWLWFGQQMGPWQMAGAAMIAGAGAIITVRSK
ncbi:DMT family transporter [Marimonas lutisalis]|uniref:DMT family transporter n=1 Tax=Marimonas lutisalis TaxID=2545756 RepID=UPI0010F5148F|nr:DMT family transporter [Marimonas lutisalis]